MNLEELSKLSPQEYIKYINLFGSITTDYQRVNVRVDVFKMPLVDFDEFIDEDNHSYYQHYSKVGQRLYKSDGSILYEDGRTHHGSFNSRQRIIDIQQLGATLKDLENNCQYVICKWANGGLVIQFHAENYYHYNLDRFGQMLFCLSARYNEQQIIYKEISYRYVEQYNKYIDAHF
jgi:hypothetical protein